MMQNEIPKGSETKRHPSPVRQTCRVPWCEEEPDEHVPVKIGFSVSESPTPISVMLGLNLCIRHMDELEKSVNAKDVTLHIALDRVREYERPGWMDE